MADTISTSKELIIENYFVDGDTRTQTLKNPKANITGTEIQALQTYMQTEQPIIGDQSGAAFGRINVAYTRTTTKRRLDLTP